ncbi:MAG TPA: glycosyltransferase family 4 protein [Planctomycetota bacterium]|nr:glycosyltransferase family 4 protein [Planctomycetota bacterium]
MTDDEQSQRLRVLVLADVCNPDWPSLPVVGYKYARALSRHAETVVVTQVRNRPNIERDGLGAARVVYLDTEKIAAPMYRAAEFLRKGSGTGWTIQMAMDYPGYLAFEKAVWRIFRADLKAGLFDLVHRITPMSPTLPSYLPRRCPVPFVLGPLNGNLPWPPQFTAELKREREWFSVFRRFYKVLPYVRSTYACSGAILAAFDHTMRDLPAATLPKAFNFPEVGIDPELFSMPERPRRTRQTILYAGRLVPYKLPEVVIRAFASSSSLRRHRLVIVGDGPERPRLESLVRDQGLGDCIEFLGQKTQTEVGRLMRESEIFAFPSIRELGAGVVVEAMACGMACVVVDYGGPATLIDSDRGAKVELGTLDELVGRFARELESLAADPDRVATLGRAAHRHAMAHYAWDAKARKTVEIYRWLLGRVSEKPRFWDAVAI